MPLTLQVITPERVVYSDSGVESVTLPGSEGQLTVLPRHAALMTALQAGAITARKAGEELDIALSGGFLEVLNDNVTVLATTAERAEEIDLERAMQARQRAEESLRARSEAIDVLSAVAAIERAAVRVRVAERRRRRTGSTPPPQRQG